MVQQISQRASKLHQQIGAMRTFWRHLVDFGCHRRGDRRHLLTLAICLGQPLLARYWQNLAESGGEESLILKNKPIGTERVPKGPPKVSQGATKIYKSNRTEKGGRDQRERAGGGIVYLFFINILLFLVLGGGLGFVEHFWRHLVDLESQFRRQMDLGGSIPSAFLDVVGVTAKNRKTYIC